MKIIWLDISEAGAAKTAIVEEAIHQRVDAIVAADSADLATVPPTVKRVLLLRAGRPPESLENVDIVISEGKLPTELTVPDGVQQGKFVEIVDAPSLEEACTAANRNEWSVLSFRDPTKIPLEIVLAAAQPAGGAIVTAVADVTEAQIVFGVLERGSDGVLFPARAVGEVTELRAGAATELDDLDLVELEVTGIAHVGMGERACVDTCSQFHEDEGILVGSHSKGMILCCSETHPLPYMPTRPFRVNAGAIHSYTLTGNSRTSYLSELVTGSQVRAVDAKGRSRMVTVGRVKIESRPLLAIDAVAPGGRKLNLIVQDDWHVRVLGPGGTVLNTTEIRPGDKVLGYLPAEERHVGYPISEFCLEQ